MAGKEKRRAVFAEVGPIRPMADFWGRPLKRHVPGRALRRALQRFLSRTRGPLMESLDRLTGPPPGAGNAAGVRARLFQEGQHQYVFRVTARFRDRKPVEAAMVVSKNDGRHSRLGAAELSHLRTLRERLGSTVVRPLCSGVVAVREGSVVREKRLFAYFTEWLHGFHELGVDRRMNFFINELPFHHFDRRETDRIKGLILAALFSSYDPAAGQAMEPPRTGAGDIVITRPRKGRPFRIKVVACRKMATGLSLEGCLLLYLGYYGHWSGNVFHLVPGDLGTLQEAIRHGLLSRGDVTPQQVLGALQGAAEALAFRARMREEWTPAPAIHRLLRRTDWLLR